MPNDFGLPGGPLQAYLATRQANQRAGALDVESASRLMGILASAQAQQQRAQMNPLQMQLLQAQIEASQGNAQDARLLNAERIGQLQRQAATAENQTAARNELAYRLSPRGSFGAGTDQERPNAQVFNNDAEAIAALQKATAEGRSFTGNVPNPGMIQSLAVQADPTRAIPQILKQQQAISPATSNPREPVGSVKHVPGGYVEKQDDGKWIFVRTDVRGAGGGGTTTTSPSQKPPVGFRFKDNGDLERIPGGPKDPAANPTEGGGVAGESAGKVAMADQAIVDIREARKIIFDDKGEMRHGVVAAMNVPGTAGMPGNTSARMAYSKLYNAVEAKLRIETGAAATQREVESIARRFIPSMLDSKKTAADKLARLEEFMATTLDQVKGVKRDALRSGNVLTPRTPDVTTPSIDSLLDKYK